MNKIKEIRQQAQLTLDEVSSGTGINRATLNRYENGNTEPKMSALEKLSDYFKVSIAELTGINVIDEINNHMEKGQYAYLNKQLARLQSNQLQAMQPLAVADAIQLIMDLYEKYEFNDNKTTDVSSILRSLNFMINNAIDDENDYQDTIDRFTKLVNNLKAQNKKAPEDNSEAE